MSISSNVVGNSNNENNFSHKLHKILPSGGYLGRLLAQSLKARLPLIGNALQPLAKSVLIPLRLTEQHQ